MNMKKYLLFASALLLMALTACSDDDKSEPEQKPKDCYLGEVVIVDRKYDFGEIRVVALPDDATPTQVNSLSLPVVDGRVMFHLSDLSNMNYEEGGLLYFKVKESVPQIDEGFHYDTEKFHVDSSLSYYTCKLSECTE